MRNKIDERLDLLRTTGRKGLMTHVVVGYPSLETTVDLVRTMEHAGVDFVELQIPFSDPLADGPVIQQACEASLLNGTKVRDAFEVAQKLSTETTIPLLFMAYFNTVYKYGVERFCRDANKAGISGLIIPDVPLEAAQHEHFLKHCRTNNLHNIITLAPSSTPERIKKNRQIASGFVYCMGYQGVTGGRLSLDSAAQRYLERVRADIGQPIAVGFGIATRQQLGDVYKHADLAVVGSALISRIAAAKQGQVLAETEQFLKTLLK